MSDQVLYLMSHYDTSPSPATGQPMKMCRDYYKIGVASDVKRRLSSINTSTPHTVELETTVECDDAVRVERALHNLHELGHYTGEWFKLDMNAINSLCALEKVEADRVEKVVKRMRHRGFESHNSLYVDLMRHRNGDVEVAQ